MYVAKFILNRERWALDGRSGVVPISAYTYEHLRPYMGVFAYTSNVVPNIFCIDSQKISADAQKALGADGYWSRQINNSN